MQRGLLGRGANTKNIIDLVEHQHVDANVELAALHQQRPLDVLLNKKRRFVQLG